MIMLEIQYSYLYIAEYNHVSNIDISIISRMDMVDDVDTQSVVRIILPFSND